MYQTFRAPPNSSKKKWIESSGWVTTIFSVLVIIDSFFGNFALNQMHLTSTPMTINTALAFFCCGTALLLTQYPAISQLIIIIPVATSLATLVEYFGSVSLGIDDFFFKTATLQHLAESRRMAPSSAVGFTLFGIGFLLMNFRLKAWTIRDSIVLFFGTLIITFGAANVCGYLTEIPSAANWFGTTGMAIYTALGMILLGTTLIALVRNSDHPNTSLRSKRWLPIPIGLAALSVTLILWQAHAVQESHHLKEIVKLNAEELSESLKNTITPQVDALKRMALRAASGKEAYASIWESDAYNHVKSGVGLSGIGWIDKNYLLWKRAPPSLTRPPIGYDFRSDKPRFRALKKAASEKSVQSTSSLILLITGMRGFVIDAPIFKNGILDGFITAGFDIEKLLNKVLQSAKFAEYEVRIFENGKEIFSSAPLNIKATDHYSEISAEAVAKLFDGIHWKIKLNPSKAEVQRVRSKLPDVTLAVGSALSLLLALFTHFAQQARMSEEEIRQKREKLDLALEVGVIGSWIRNFADDSIIWDERMYKLFGYEVGNGPSTFQVLLDCIHPSDRDRFIKEQEIFFFSGGVLESEFKIIRGDGAIRTLLYRGRLFKNQDGNPVRLAGVCWDITHRKILEEKIQQTTNELRLKDGQLNVALKAAVTGTWVLNIETRRLIWNDDMHMLFGTAPASFSPTFEEVLSKVHEDDRVRVRATVLESIANNSDFEAEFQIIQPDGSTRIVLARGSTTSDGNGKPESLCGVCWDVTVRKIAEDKLRSSLEEKEVLLREIHHRVKNNLNIISSLLDLQSRHIGNAKEREVFLESRTRVFSMALIHEKLYQSKNLACIDFPRYVDDLITSLYDSYGVDSDDFIPELNISDLQLDLDTAIPCSLIINELVSNAFKHAFKGKRSGRISINLHPTPDDNSKCELSIIDDGVGLPMNFNLEEADSLGLKLVRSLARQIGGELKTFHPTGGGSGFGIHFKIDSTAEVVHG